MGNSRYNRTCILCGNTYRFCHSCREFAGQPAWKEIYCSNNCRTIFNTAVNYAQKAITKEEAKAILSKCDLTNKENFKADILEVVNQIMEEEPRKAEEPRKSEEPKKEEKTKKESRQLRRRY